MCTHIESIWTKTKSAWKRHNAGEGSSSHHYFFLCCFFEFEQATPGQKLYPLVSFFFLFFFSLIFRKLFVGKHMLLISNQVEREEDEHIHYGNFKAFSNYILNTSRVLASFEVQDFFDCAFKCIGKLKRRVSHSTSPFCHLRISIAMHVTYWPQTSTTIPVNFYRVRNSIILLLW